jgi:hypothetical protein
MIPLTQQYQTWMADFDGIPSSSFALGLMLSEPSKMQSEVELTTCQQSWRVRERLILRYLSSSDWVFEVAIDLHVE